MYICNGCNAEFDTPNQMLIVDRNMGSAATMLQPVDICPSCHSADIEEAERCTLCGKRKATVNMSAHVDGVCVKCLSILMAKAKIFLSDNLSKNEYDLLLDYLDLDAKVV